MVLIWGTNEKNLLYSSLQIRIDFFPLFTMKEKKGFWGISHAKINQMLHFHTVIQRFLETAHKHSGGRPWTVIEGARVEISQCVCVLVWECYCFLFISGVLNMEATLVPHRRASSSDLLVSWTLCESAVAAGVEETPWLTGDPNTYLHLVSRLVTAWLGSSLAHAFTCVCSCIMLLRLAAV